MLVFCSSRYKVSARTSAQLPLSFSLASSLESQRDLSPSDGFPAIQRRLDSSRSLSSHSSYRHRVPT